MIIAEQQLDQVNALIFAEYDRRKNLENLPPAPFRLTVRLPDADELNDAHLKVVLYAQQHDQHLQPWTEEGRLILSEEEVKSFQPFDAVFVVDKQYRIRVEFLVTQLTEEGEHEAVVGYGLTTLSDILSSHEERLDIDLMDMSHNKIPEAYAELAIDWLKFFHDKMVIEVNVRIEKHSGWPFTSARPFFVLYLWVPQLNRWSPIYRSEVLSKSIAYPDSRGAMVFELAEISVKRTLGGDDTRPVRLEFFHYKTKGNPKMLGFFESSLRHLRLSRKEPNLKLELSTFAEGELVGELRMIKSKLSAARSYFCLEATFGGDVAGDFVYFDVSLTDTKPRKGWKRDGRPYYTIARYSDAKVWEKVYHSESASRVMGRLHKYKVAKLTERRLNCEKITRPISIMFFQTTNGRRMVIGRIETTVGALLDADTGALFPLEGSGVGNGYVRVEQSEGTENRVYFGLHCILERRDEVNRSSSTEEGVEEVSSG